MPDKNLKGITIGNETVEGWIARKESEEKAKDDKEQIKADRQTFYSKPRGRYADDQGESGQVICLPTSYLNQLNMKEKLMANIEKGQSLVQMIITILTSGTHHHAKSIAEQLTKMGRKVKPSEISNPLYMIYKSPIGHLLERSGKGGAYTYILSRYGQELTSEQLYKLYHKSFKLNLWNIVDEVPALKNMGYKPPEGEPPEMPKKGVKKKEPAPETNQSSIVDHINRGVALLEKEAREHDVNLNINVHVRFSFSID